MDAKGTWKVYLAIHDKALAGEMFMVGTEPVGAHESEVACSPLP